MKLETRVAEMRDFFNEKADGYDDVHLPMIENKIAIAAALPEGTLRVLDLGAGTGLELFALFERFPQAHVDVVDVSVEMLRALRERPFADKLDIVCGDFFAVDFGVDYDAVISSAALHHFAEKDKARLYAKVFACLRPGGMFVNSDGVVDTLQEQDERFRELAENGQNYRHYDTPLAVCNEKKLLEGAGFIDFAVSDLPRKWYKLICVKKPEK